MDQRIAQHQDFIVQQAQLTGQAGPQGGGILPVINGQATDFGNAGAFQAQDQIIRPPTTPSSLLGNSFAGQTLVDLQRIEQQNNPILLQQEAQRKQQESLQDLNKQLALQTHQQNQGGTQKARDIFFGGDITQDVRNQANAARNIVLDESREPSKERDFGRDVRLKQTPGARAIGTDDGGPQNTINPSFEGTVVNGLIKKYPQYRTPVLDPSGAQVTNPTTGRPLYEPNERAYAVARIASEMFAGTKKPNFGQIEAKAIAEEERQRREQAPIQAPNLQKSAGQLFRGRQQTPTTQPSPVTPQPTAQQKASESVKQSTSLGNSQLKQEAQAVVKKHGKTEDVINFLLEKGLNPDEF